MTYNKLFHNAKNEKKKWWYIDLCTDYKKIVAKNNNTVAPLSVNFMLLVYWY